VLTAEEAASLDLRGVEWAVLSGCGTGLGPVQTGEGVLGLRRAFRVAGADTLIISLWPVEDHAARQWFRHLYEARLAGAPTPRAMQTASLEVLERRRAAATTTHPFYWGAFVAAGDWK
jgi:CHAT domain-containing protein